MLAENDCLGVLGILYYEVFLGLDALESFHVISVALGTGVVGWLLGDKTLDVSPALILKFGPNDVIILVNDGKVS